MGGGSGSGSGDGSVAVNIDTDNIHPGLPRSNAKMVARNFRYMRRKPTIMAFPAPKGKKY